MVGDLKGQIASALLSPDHTTRFAQILDVNGNNVLVDTNNLVYPDYDNLNRDAAACIPCPRLATLYTGLLDGKDPDAIYREPSMFIGPKGKEPLWVTYGLFEPIRKEDGGYSFRYKTTVSQDWQEVSF